VSQTIYVAKNNAIFLLQVDLSDSPTTQQDSLSLKGGEPEKVAALEGEKRFESSQHC